MQKLKLIVVTIIVTVLTGVVTIYAQDTAGSTATSMSSAVSHTEVGHQDDTSQYLWIAAIALIAVALAVGLIVRSRRKITDNRPQTGADINNPASGI